MSAPVLVVPTGAANLASVCAGLRRAGAAPRIARDPGEVGGAERVVLPGVGAFGEAMARLRSGGWDEALRDRVGADRPLLAVCLGLQLLAATSEEGPGVAGLSVFDMEVAALDGPVRVPHMGWNRVEPDGGSLLRPGFAYFAHGFAVARPPAGTIVSWTEYGGRRVAALERGAILGCQFHPELSGAWGRDLLARWVRRERRTVPC